MSGDAQSFFIRTTTPASIRFKGQVSHWAFTRLARKLISQLFISLMPPIRSHGCSVPRALPLQKRSKRSEIEVRLHKAASFGNLIFPAMPLLRSRQSDYTEQGLAHDYGGAP